MPSFQLAKPIENTFGCVRVILVDVKNVLEIGDARAFAHT